jgi:7-cyano-7-deazaguanine synthase in queuosine biosynthesis
MWSGGIDSTYVLAHLLKETNHNVFAHHIYLKNCERRDLAEARSIEKLVPKLRAIRDFTFTVNFINDEHMPSLTWDMARTCFEAGAVARGWYYAREPKKIDTWTIGTCAEEGHWQERFDIISQSTLAAQWAPGRTDYMTFELYPTVKKSEEMEYLGKLGLLQDCWYCRYPRYTSPTSQEPCGKCKTCAEVRSAQLDLGKIPTIIKFKEHTNGSENQSRPNL